MDKKRLIKNVITGLLVHVVILIYNLFSRRVLINIVGDEALGIVALFKSVTDFVALVSLGMSGVIPLCMYRAIISKDNKKLVAVYCYFTKVYYIIFGLFFGISLSITPLIPFFTKNYSLDYNLYVLYIIYISCISLSYLYTVRTSLINAYKNNYIGNIIHSISMVIKHSLQIMVLYLTTSFYVYMSIFAVSEIISFVLFYLYTNKKHKEIVSSKETIDKETKKEIHSLIRGSALHTLSFTIVYSIEEILIGSFIGVDVLAKYSNYNLILSALALVFYNIYSQIGSIIGYAYFENDKEKFKKYFNFFYLFNYFIASFFSLCYFKCITPFINMFFDSALLDTNIVIVLTISRFVSFILHSERLFKYSTGLFKYDSWKCVPEALINFVLTIVLVNYIGIIGLLIARIATELLISETIEPYVVYKHLFDSKPTKYYIFNYLLTGVFVGLLYGLNYSLEISIENQFVNFIVSGFYACIFVLPSFILLLIYTKKTFGIKNIIKSIISLKKENKQE